MQRRQQEGAGITHVVDLLSRGDGDGAVAIWFGDVHNFTHNTQPQIFEKDKDLGKSLCKAVLDLENDLNGPQDSVANADSWTTPPASAICCVTARKSPASPGRAARSTTWDSSKDA